MISCKSSDPRTMVITQIPPLWTDRDDCLRCHTTFSAFTRKHHCRACGETFCAACSSKQCSIPEYGVEEDVRVCVSCYDRIKTTGSVRARTTTTIQREADQPELDEEDDLQLAIYLSQSEPQEKERQKKLLTQQYAAKSTIEYPPIPIGSAPLSEDNYWENQTKKELITIHPLPSNEHYVQENEIDRFVNTVHEHLNNIKFRMLSNQQRGRNISTDTAVQSVYLLLQNFYPELHHFVKLLDDKQAYYESLQDKLNQLKDAREALNALREEHVEGKRQQAFERERQRQMQLAMKLDDMRQKKQAYLEYQRQIHLQRLVEQEAEMKARLELQRRFTQQREHQTHMPLAPSVPVNYYPPMVAQIPVPILPSNPPTTTEQTLILFD